VLARLMARAREDFGIGFHDHRRRAKRRALGINNAKNMQQRRPLYRDLLKVTKKTVSQAESTLRQLAEVRSEGPVQTAHLTALSTELRHYIDLAQRVIYQTERRVLDEANVPASEKAVSIFEPHTDIIIKDQRETLYGHKPAGSRSRTWSSRPGCIVGCAPSGPASKASSPSSNAVSDSAVASGEASGPSVRTSKPRCWPATCWSSRATH